ncbi:hypothetical protein EJ05DRAFT_436318 [Pseudovirgaria hyperparasitica]|uniref:Uncharacterized protein n=1 Tax=Pseudovirgaria hyperparasitica TaxID=470096 RepID=A0A6A6WBW2_9PEZI|nr:uncharacterized protein EJ05DRAFT_436318 [Pseudovirgaria hyperparasitica]KAF2760183.1 hypothetical protein EJ05DRAFT_436318 [Pseudovirgaria hyperparasitica]
MLVGDIQTYETAPRTSLFEAVISAHPPILESLLSQLPTVSIIDLFHTSRYLREFLASYPLAWKTLSFRLPQPAPVVGSPGNETPDGRDRQSKQYALDGLLIQVVVPLGTRLRNLDLCNTAVTGVSLVSRVLQPRISMLQHLSVRGCKNVSIKYHLVPFLEPYSKKGVPWAVKGELALKSLYAYRCRHHRRRPYLPQSLARKDSDSEPTHQLIEICHELGIWTDTAWCPTPAGRCFRRKDYHNGRAAPGTPEVWVPFDRLWRSCNRIGPSHGTAQRTSDGRLWEDAETGYDGEALGPEDGSSLGEGKDVPAHLRKSHRTFVDGVKCSQCDEDILERCEQCSVRMHCMGCRKTLCASCAFNRPVPRKRAKTRHFTEEAFGNQQFLLTNSHQAQQASISLEGNVRRSESPANDRFWWAPGATRSPNMMTERPDDGDSDSEDGGNNNFGAVANPHILANMSPLKLNMHWCCLEPIFSGGGGITFLGNSIGGRGADKIRAAPLPRSPEFKDPEFSSTIPSGRLKNLKANGLYGQLSGEDMNILSFLTQDSLMLQESTCPRSLCQDCYRSFRWKVSCRGCKKPLCKEHDFRALKIRKCGFRDLQTERDFVLNYKADRNELVIPAFQRNPPAYVGTLADEQQATSSTVIEPSTTAMHINGPAPPPHTSVPSQELHPPTDMAASISSRGLALDNNLDISYYNMPFTRPRSLSVSDLRHRVTSTSHATSQRANAPHARVPRPGHPRHPVQWEGCGAYYCQSPRAIGDSRSRCPATLKECKECGVYVCENCMLGNQLCPCGYCSMNYHCPHCDQKPHIQKQCRLQEECKARLAAQEADRRRREHEREGAKAADELAAQLGEFFFGLFNDDTPAATDSALTAIDNHLHNFVSEDGEMGDDEDDAPVSDEQFVTFSQAMQVQMNAELANIDDDAGGVVVDGGVLVDLDFTDVVDDDDDLDDFSDA